MKLYLSFFLNLVKDLDIIFSLNMSIMNTRVSSTDRISQVRTAEILQSTFLNAFSGMEIYVFLSEFH